MNGIEPVIPLTPVRKLYKVVQRRDEDTAHQQSKQRSKHPPETAEDEQPVMHIDEMA